MIPAASTNYLAGVDSNCSVLVLYIEPNAPGRRQMFGADAFFVPKADTEAYKQVLKDAAEYAKRAAEIFFLSRQSGMPVEATGKLYPRSERRTVVFEDLGDALQSIGAKKLRTLSEAGGLRYLVFLTPVATAMPVVDALRAEIPDFCVRRFGASPGEKLLPNIGHQVLKFPMSYTQMSACTSAGCGDKPNGHAHECTNAEPRIRQPGAGNVVTPPSTEEARAVGAMFPVKAESAAVWIDAPAFGTGARLSLIDIALSGKLVSFVNTMNEQAIATRGGLPLDPEIIKQLQEMATATMRADTPGPCPGGICPPDVLAAAAAGQSPTDGHVGIFRDEHTMAVAASVLEALSVPTVVISSAHRNAGMEKVLLADFNKRRDTVIGRRTSHVQAISRLRAAEAARERRAGRAIAQQFKRDADSGRFAAATLSCPLGTSESSNRDVDIKIVSYADDDEDTSRRLSPFETDAIEAAMRAPAPPPPAGDCAACPVVLLANFSITAGQPSHVNHLHLYDAVEDPVGAALNAYGSGEGHAPANMTVHHYAGIAGGDGDEVALDAEDPPGDMEGADAEDNFEDPDIAICRECDGADDASDGDRFEDVADQLPRRRYVGRATISTKCSSEKRIEETITSTFSGPGAGRERTATERRSRMDPGSPPTINAVTREYTVLPCGRLEEAARASNISRGAALRVLLGKTQPREITAIDDVCPKDSPICRKLRQLDSETVASVAAQFTQTLSSALNAAAAAPPITRAERQAIAG